MKRLVRFPKTELSTKKTSHPLQQLVSNEENEMAEPVGRAALTTPNTDLKASQILTLQRTIGNQAVIRILRKSADGEEELQKSAASAFTTAFAKSADGEEELQKGKPTGERLDNNTHGAGCGCALCRSSGGMTAEPRSQGELQRTVDVSVVEHTDSPPQAIDLESALSLAKPSTSVKADAAATIGLGGDYGLTYPETVEAKITAKKVGNAWFPKVKSLKGHYSKQSSLLAGQSEITGPGGNTTQLTYMDQIKNLALLGEDVGNPWYMLKAVKRHENVHAKRFAPGLKKAATAIASSLEAVSIPDVTGKKTKQAVIDLQADGAYQAALAGAQALWLAEILTLVAGDHASGGPTEKAEHTVVDPMKKKICAFAKKKKWPASPYC